MRADERLRPLALVVRAQVHGLAGLLIDERLPRELRESFPLETLAGVAMDVLLDGLRA